MRFSHSNIFYINGLLDNKMSQVNVYVCVCKKKNHYVTTLSMTKSQNHAPRSDILFITYLKQKSNFCNGTKEKGHHPLHWYSI